MTHNIGNFILISAPNEKTAQETWDRLNQATGNLSANYKFNIPDLKVKKVVFKINLFSVSVFFWSLEIDNSE